MVDKGERKILVADTETSLSLAPVPSENIPTPFCV